MELSPESVEAIQRVVRKWNDYQKTDSESMFDLYKLLVGEGVVSDV